MAKVKVFNKNKFDIGINLINPIREQNIKAGSFTIVDEDDVYYLDSICTLFKKGMLVIEKPEVKETLGIVEDNPNIISDKEIEELLLGNFIKMRKDLSEITEVHVINNIHSIACKVANNLSGAKIKFLNNYCGRDIILEETSE